MSDTNNDTNVSSSENLDRIVKDELALADVSAGGGILTEQKANSFILRAIQSSPLLNAMRTFTLNRPSASIPKLGMADWVLYNKAECTAPTAGQKTKAVMSEVTIDPKRISVSQCICNEVLEDNIRREALLADIETQLFRRVASNVSDVILNSDTANADPDANKQAVLALQDGLIKQAANNPFVAGNPGHVNPETAGAPVDKDTLSSMYKALPNQYKTDKSQLAYVMSLNNEECLRNTVADRQTELGDRFHNGASSFMIGGIPVVGDPHIPDNVVLLSNPRNMIFAPSIYDMRRVVNYEAQTDSHELYIHLYFGFAWEELEAVVYQEVA